MHHIIFDHRLDQIYDLYILGGLTSFNSDRADMGRPTKLVGFLSLGYT